MSKRKDKVNFSSSKKLVQVFLALCLAMLSVVCRAEVESLTFIHSDHLGSPIVATDQQGEVLWRKDYQPFGSSTGSEDSDNSVGFTGHLEDDSLGLTYMQGRWYHPELGRFTAIDPVGFVDGNVSSFNRYAYANNNPYRYTDPDGKIPVDTLFDAANVVYDLGKAGFGAATGNSALVAEGLADAAADAVAMAIPYVPAGSSKVARMAVEAAEEAADKNVAKGPEKLYHYTDNKGLDGITSSNKLNPSLKANNPSDARYGDGQYLSDIAPGTKTCAQLSRCFFGNPFQGKKVENYIEIDVRGLNVQKGRDGVYVVPGNTPLDLTGRVTGSGKN